MQRPFLKFAAAILGTGLVVVPFLGLDGLPRDLRRQIAAERSRARRDTRAPDRERAGRSHARSPGRAGPVPLDSGQQAVARRARRRRRRPAVRLARHGAALRAREAEPPRGSRPRRRPARARDGRTRNVGTDACHRDPEGRRPLGRAEEKAARRDEADGARLPGAPRVRSRSGHRRGAEGAGRLAGEARRSRIAPRARCGRASATTSRIWQSTAAARREASAGQYRRARHRRAADRRREAARRRRGAPAESGGAAVADRPAQPVVGQDPGRHGDARQRVEQVVRPEDPHRDGSQGRAGHLRREVGRSLAVQVRRA